MRVVAGTNPSATTRATLGASHPPENEIGIGLLHVVPRNRRAGWRAISCGGGSERYPSISSDIDYNSISGPKQPLVILGFVREEGSAPALRRARCCRAG